MYIVAFEGIDNAGKTTQCLKLSERLKVAGYQVATTLDQPSPLHELIKSYFQRGEFSPHLKTLLFAAELLDHWHSHLSKAEIIIFDRYVYSLLAYGLIEHVDRGWVEDIAAPLPKTDLVIYIDIPLEVYLERIKDRDDYRSPYSYDQLAVVRNNYLTLAKKSNFFVIDGTKKEAEIEDLVYQEVSAFLRKSNLQ